MLSPFLEDREHVAKKQEAPDFFLTRFNVVCVHAPFFKRKTK